MPQRGDQQTQGMPTGIPTTTGGIADAYLERKRREQIAGGPSPSMHGSIAAPQGGDWNTAGNKQKGGEVNSRTDGTYSPQASRMQQGPDRQAELPMAGQEGYGDMIRQRRAEQGGPKTLEDLRNQAQGRGTVTTDDGRVVNRAPMGGLPSKLRGGGTINGITYGKSGAPQMTPAEVRQLQINSYNQSRQPTEAEKTFMMAQGNRRNPGSMDMSLLRKPQVTRKPTASTTVNLRKPNQGVKQQFTDRQNRALGNTMQTSASNAKAMQNAASRYRRAGLRATANRAKPRTSLPQLYGN
jgi:hypothetical protein